MDREQVAGATGRVVAVGLGEQGRLLGWSVIENMSGQDWEEVELTLVSGNPVTFRQALYAAYYASRPEVPVEVLGRVLPSPDTGAVAAARTEQPRARELPAPRRAVGRTLERLDDEGPTLQAPAAASLASFR